MDVEKLFQGIAVIFDDEISNSDSTISNIKKLIEKKNIPRSGNHTIVVKCLICDTGLGL